MRKTIAITAAVLLAWVVPAVGQTVEPIETPVEKYGYALVIPEGFMLTGTVSDTATWSYRAETPAASTAADGEGPVFTIWVNRMPVETMNLAGLYEIGRKYDADSTGSVGAAIRDLRDLTIDGGYGYWYKEADKPDPAANHRWIAKVFGNGAVYTVCAAGPFGEFATWGPVFDRVIASFRLVPTKGE